MFGKWATAVTPSLGTSVLLVTVVMTVLVSHTLLSLGRENHNHTPVVNSIFHDEFWMFLLLTVLLRAECFAIFR